MSIRLLAIESSCDETSVAVVEDGRRIHANVVASQTALHARTGGIVPEVAARAHLRWMIPVLEEACAEARRAARLVVLFGPASERLAPLFDTVPTLGADDVEDAIATAADHLEGAETLLVTPMFPLSMGERIRIAPALRALARS